MLGQAVGNVPNNGSPINANKAVTPAIN